jgi:uncharacterized protein (DUF2252 family)
VHAIDKYFVTMPNIAVASDFDAGGKGESATRKQWLAELRKDRSKTIDAPLWLWNSTVELVSSHEAGYLEHCRRYATST